MKTVSLPHILHHTMLFEALSEKPCGNMSIFFISQSLGDATDKKHDEDDDNDRDNISSDAYRTVILV